MGGYNIGAYIITYTNFRVPYYDYSRVDPKALFYLLRPVYSMYETLVPVRASSY